jgi:sugar lactone lactonase YvrE
MRDIKTLASGLTFTECPRWHGDRWWFSDFYTHAIYSMKADGSDLQKEADVPAQPSGLGWLPDGRLIFVSMKDRKVPPPRSR